MKNNKEQKIEAIIFDIDGTLYQFDQGDESHFSSSRFGKQIHQNCIGFFMNTLGLKEDQALEKYTDYRARYNDEVSLGVEKELGINRSEYFANTWDLDPSEFIQPNTLLIETLSSLPVKTGILSAAPCIWVNKVLNFLEIKHIFDPDIFTGDPDLRKPNPKVFEQFSKLWGMPAQSILSIGDQEKTDIIPAKSIGMMTARIGQNIKTEADFIAPNAIEMITLLKQKGII